MDVYKVNDGKKQRWTAKDKVLVFMTVVFGILAAALVVVVAVKFEVNDDKTTDTPGVVHATAGAIAGNGNTGITSVSHATVTAPQTTVKEPTVCTKPICVKTAAGLLDAMDFSMDPCEDFYTYSCGNWNKNHIIPDDKPSVNRFGEIRDSVKMKLKGLLEEPMNDTIAMNAVEKAKRFYRSCIDEDSLRKRGQRDAEILLESLGGWPLLNNAWNSTGFNIEQQLIALRNRNYDIIITISTSPDDRKVTDHIILLDQATLGMPSREYYLKGTNDTLLVIYKEFAKAVASKFGASGTDVDKHITAMVDFEIKLANLTKPKSERRNSNLLYHKMNVSSLHDEIPQFDWLQYLNGVYKKYNITIGPDEDLIVYEPKYLKNALDLVKNTSPSTVANYFLWRVIMARLDDMAEEFRLLRTGYNKVMLGVKHAGARWRSCVDNTAVKLPDPVGRLFVDSVFDKVAKEEALALIASLRKEFSQMITDVPWMDAKTREKALAKQQAIIQKIAYPDWILNDTKLNEEYQGLSFKSDNYFDNVDDVTMFSVDKKMGKLRDTVDKTIWPIGASIVNAFYDPTQNSITFPAGILQPPFYDKDYPKSLIYGGIGLVIGHEITHGFDDQGRRYDKDGNLYSWWTNTSSSRFDEMARCIINQYSSYKFGPDHINGKNTQGENIADNGGIKAAFKAYNTWLKSNNEEYDKLPSLNLTHNQLFFINFAQGWCGKRTPEALHNQILTDPHSPGRYRIIGTLSNNEDFSMVFQCKPNSKMNPKKKCSVW
ncbi:hypothetical protein SNE40_014425 [Patella caerulea]|uniref:Uncharacterized protein n=1 Tax=Patella caerulea TaxID=87958 RepID=A0AAN8PH85_PATCE